MTHLKPTGFVLHVCMDSFLLQSNDAQSNPERENWSVGP